MRVFSTVIMMVACAARLSGTATSTTLERIEVAPDHWTFRESQSHRPFVPFGVNYTPSWSGWAPDYLSTEKFDIERITADFDRMRDLGVNVCKVVFSGKRMLPDPQTSDGAVLDNGCLQRFDQVLAIAAQRGVRLLATFEIAWHGGAPNWFNQNGRWFGARPRRTLVDFWKQFATRYRDDGRIFAYSFCVETALRDWDTTASLDAWRDWAKVRYGTIPIANAEWGTTFTEWAQIPAAGVDGKNSPDWRARPEGTDENENKTNDAFLYDFMLFREHAAFHYMVSQTRAVKSVDPQALCTMGFIQWGILHRSYGKTYEGPLFGIEYNAHELARAFDFVGIHFYPTFTADRGDETQLQCLELWARWAFRGKPVILEEFNMYPVERNPVWCEKAIRHSQRYVSGWLTWTFQNVPNSDDITKVCGLYDAGDNLTAWGTKFRELSAEVRGWKLEREKSLRTVRADKKFLLTSGRYHDFLDELLASDSQAVDFHMESNPSIDRLLRAH
ncbi:MAG: beta-galactosidase [Candidatus Sumerlaeaceae bacterium]